MLIRGGTVIDPSQALDAPRDVRLRGERIHEIADRLETLSSELVLDARGLVVVPGLIDLHVHVFWGVSHYGIDPDPHCLGRGVTTAVDAGSAGAYTFGALRRYIMDTARTRILAFLNVAGPGMISPSVGELRERGHLDADATQRTIAADRPLIRGIKVRLSREVVGANGQAALLAALRAAEDSGVPLMVHVGNTPFPLPRVLRELRPGDLVTHCYHGRRRGIVDGRGHLIEAARRAADRGVLFDVGHGRGSSPSRLRAGHSPKTSCAGQELHLLVLPELTSSPSSLIR